MKYHPNNHISYHGKIVVFDLDDTLYKERDYAISGFKAVASLFSDNPFSQMKEAFLKGENPMDAALNFSCDSPLPKIETMLSTYRTHTPEISLPADVREMLTTLRDKGIPMGLITDGRSVSQRNKIKALGLEEFFSQEMIFISEETGAEKSSPASFREIVRMWPEASKFYYIGDNPAKDFLIPNLMGWESIQILHNHEINIHSATPDVEEDYRPSHKIFSFNELTNLLTE